MKEGHAGRQNTDEGAEVETGVVQKPSRMPSGNELWRPHSDDSVRVVSALAIILHARGPGTGFCFGELQVRNPELLHIRL